MDVLSFFLAGKNTDIILLFDKICCPPFEFWMEVISK